MTVLKVASAIILDEKGRMLFTQRGRDREFPEAWELPGGKIEKGENASFALHRELHEELNLECSFVWPRAVLTMAFNPPVVQAAVDVSLHVCKIPEDAEPQLLEDQLDWSYEDLSFVVGWLDTLPSVQLLHAHLLHIGHGHVAGGIAYLRTFQKRST